MNGIYFGNERGSSQPERQLPLGKDVLSGVAWPACRGAGGQALAVRSLGDAGSSPGPAQPVGFSLSFLLKES